MRSTSDRTTPPHQEDLTAVARIRAAAMARFAAHGFSVGLRAIAADAGVTAGLITHHFGSKEGLRRACDAEVLRQMDEAKRDSVIMGGPADLLSQLTQVEEYLPACAYALRSLSDGGELARSLMDSFVAETASLLADGVASGAITPSPDDTARARYLVYAEAGALLLYLRYEAADPTDIQGSIRDYYTRYTPVSVAIYSRPLFTDPSMFAAYLDSANRPSSSPQEDA
ncbi:TetR/AcrR family transcriptional regulator [Actinomyces denticolens]|uniref:TetR/AcrR family transcriptional regulator n=1 Tax=Actinomyces denticolens TaxID=52767 RepID=UPI0009376A6D|nr:TetR family transcriptional regulator [Actinomyces denticolens]